MKDYLKNKIFRPKWVKYCSQTLYESLFFCNNMYKLKGENIWREEASNIVEKIRLIQQDDGGFDIGYEFNFGILHKKGWSSAPESKMLVALIEYGNIFGFESVIDIIESGISWIKNNSYQIDNDKWIIPYCPRAINEVMVLNGISFALAPLAMYYNYINKDENIKKIHEGYINYLYDEFEWQEGYWKYADKKRKNLDSIQLIKVDNYHLGQQLEMHCLSYACIPNEKNREIIDSLANYLLMLHQENYPNPLPYFNYGSNEKIGVHLWGYASLINGFLQYFSISKNWDYVIGSKQIADWIYSHAWINNQFSCIYYKDTKKIDNRFYPRSDAWVINNLSGVLKYTENKNEKILESDYNKIRAQDYSGFENHASTIILKIFSKLKIIFKQLGLRSNKN